MGQVEMTLMFGIAIAFHFIPAKGIFGSEWIGLDNFRFVCRMRIHEPDPVDERIDNVAALVNLWTVQVEHLVESSRAYGCPS